MSRNCCRINNQCCNMNNRCYNNRRNPNYYGYNNCCGFGNCGFGGGNNWFFPLLFLFLI